MKRAISPQAKDKRRSELLNAALDEFFERGFSAARMADIAARAKVSKGTLYLYFPSKEAIFNELITSIALPKIHELEHNLREQGSVKQALSRLFTLLPVLIRQSSMPKIIKILISDAFAFPEIIANYRSQIIERALGTLTKVLNQGCASGELTALDPELTARLVVAPMLFAAIWSTVFEQPEQRLDVAALLEQHRKILFAALFTAKDH